MKTIRELYAYREMIISTVKKELEAKYKGSVLGFLWTFVNPLLQLVVYTIIFSVIMRAGIEKFYLYLFVGLIPWMFFSTSVAGGSVSIVSQDNLIKKIYFPRQVLPISYILAAFVNMLLTFIVIFAVLLIDGWGINFAVLWYLPVIMLVELLLALGLGMLVSALTVYFRDLEHILGIFMMAWMYMTPIMYTIDMVPEELRKFINLNPMTPVIQAYKDILYYKQAPQLETLLQATVLGVICLIIGNVVFNKLEPDFVEEL